MPDPTPATALCGDVLHSTIGDITCDLPRHDDGRHAGGDRTYWTDEPQTNGPTVQLCRPDDVAAASRAYGLPVVSDDGYNHAPECYSCHGTANRDTCPRSIRLREYAAGLGTPPAGGEATS